MPALPFFSAMPIQPSSPSNVGGLSNQNNGQPASVLDSSQSEGYFSPASSMNPGGQSQSDNLSQGLSFWQTLQETTELSDLNQGQEVAVLTPLIQAPLSTEELSMPEVPFLTPLMDRGANTETAQLVDNAVMSTNPLVNTMAKDMSSTKQEPVTIDFIESQRTASPAYQASNGEPIKTNPMDLVQRGNMVQQGGVVQQELAQEEPSAHITQRSEMMSTVSPLSKTEQAPTLGDLSTNIEEPLEEAKLGVSLKDLGLEEKPLNIHEKPITLQTPEGGVKTTTPQMTDMFQVDGFDVESLEEIAQNAQRDQTVQTKTMSQNQSVLEASKSQFKVSVPPQSPQWSEQIASRISIMNNEQVQSARIQLDPPELGLLEIKIKVQQDQVNVAFASNHQVVRDALESQAPRLKELMEQQGVDLGDVNVSDHGQEQMAHGEQQQEGSGEAQSGEWTELEGDNTSNEVTIETDSLIDDFA